MGRACSTDGGEGTCIRGFGGERGHLEDSCVDGRIILKWIFEKWERGIGGMDEFVSG